MNKNIKITVGPYSYEAELLIDQAPQTCREFLKLLPYRQKLIQARWSGESAWIPLGDFQLNVGFENQTSRPQPGEILFYPGGISETEILFPYGTTVFASKFGILEGNFFLKITEPSNLPKVGELVLQKGVQNITFELMP